MLLSAPAIAVSSIPRRKVIHSRSHWTEFETTRLIRGSSNLRFIIRSVSKEGNTSVESDVPFPSDYIDLLKQAKKATELALKDGKQLMEIEFPTAGLESVPGDGEGGNEMTDSMQLIREFCDILVTPEKARQTRIFFPEANEVKFARQVFEGASFKLDYLTKPSFFEDFGFSEKVKMADRVKPDDELFLVGYPYFNVNEMIVVEELYKEAVVNTTRKLIIFNGAIQVLGEFLERLGTNMSVCTSRKQCHP
ncbi:Domain of Uncharacterized protein function isoform 2 [Theobroma cacao]|uniref:Domain of Uncharacterized protein function isoform 2 n=1 Tax=Theobroma cacao TaxID=3641 RepID=A0A061G808_THECC|nr:Domain of Uncharacterized protein function isoform 2 [Theobroma cacao]